MNRIGQNGKNHNFEKTFPGCLGQMVNLFEMNVGVSTVQLLTDKPHKDGSALARSRSDLDRFSPLDDQMEGKVAVSAFQTAYSNRKSDRTPMKMLIAREMSKEVDSRGSPPNIIAKLMGLETLPTQETGSSIQRLRSRGHPRSHSDIPSYWEQQDRFSQYAEPNEFKDVYEVLHKSADMVCDDEITNDNTMALVRQKFAEAKRLSMDAKLCQSKQFHDALEVLNTNKELFLQCLQEPNPMLAQDLYSLRSIPPPPHTKRITILRPSKIADNDNFARSVNNDGKISKKGAFTLINGLEKSHSADSPSVGWKNYENSTQPTRIVVLKPSPVKSYDIKAVGSPLSNSPRGIDGDDFDDSIDDENRESRVVAKAITQKMRETLGKYHRDETLVSSPYSNGYVDDECSLNKSETEYAACNLSDSEVMSPVSRHSWDYVKRVGSPYSSPSFSRVSYSPESSVCREAKKRLSERWAMMESNGSCIERRPIRRSSSTLGEMLALSETRRAATPRKEDNLKGPKDWDTAADPELRTPENVSNSPRNLMRSKSVPVSSSECGTMSKTDVSILDMDGAEMMKEETKEKNVKSSFKGRVSSLFFSRNKKASKDKSLSSETRDESHSIPVPGRSCNLGNVNDIDKGPDDLIFSVPVISSKTSTSNQVSKLRISSPETGFPTERSVTSGISGSSKLNQSSSTSFLHQPYEDDRCASMAFSNYVKHEKQGVELPVNAARSNLIDKSPPIGSIARTLSWSDPCTDSVSSYPLNQPITSKGTDEDERERLFYVKSLLTSAGLQGELPLNTILDGWHSPESPLDPSLRDNYIDWKDKEILHEARRRQKRSTQKLVFDCVNDYLVEIGRYGSELGQSGAFPLIKHNNSILENASVTILDGVWTRMSTLFSSGIKCVLDDCGDNNSLVLEGVVRKEVVTKGWMDHLRSETDDIGKEMEGKLLEELVRETVVELTGNA